MPLGYQNIPMNDYRRTPLGQLGAINQQKANSTQRMRDAIAQMRRAPLAQPQRPVQPMLPMRTRKPAVAQPNDVPGAETAPNPARPAVYQKPAGLATSGDLRSQIFQEALGNRSLEGAVRFLSEMDQGAAANNIDAIGEQMMAKARAQRDAAENFGAESLVSPDVLAQEMGASGRTRYSEDAQTGRNSLNQAAETMRHVTPSGNIGVQTRSAQDIAQMEADAARERMRNQTAENEKDRTLKREESDADRRMREALGLEQLDQQTQARIYGSSSPQAGQMMQQFQNQQSDMTQAYSDLSEDPTFAKLSPTEQREAARRYMLRLQQVLEGQQ